MEHSSILRIFFTKSKYPTFRQKTSMNNQVRPQGWLPQNMECKAMEFCIKISVALCALREIMTNDFVKNILKCNVLL